MFPTNNNNNSHSAPRFNISNINTFQPPPTRSLPMNNLTFNPNIASTSIQASIRPPSQALNNSFNAVQAPVELSRSTAGLGNGVSRGMIERCEQVGFDHGFGTKKVFSLGNMMSDPIGDGLDAAPCTIRPEYNKAYTKGFKQGYEGKNKK